MCKTPGSGITSHFANAQLELKSLIFPFTVTLAPPGMVSTEYSINNTLISVSRVLATSRLTHYRAHSMKMSQIWIMPQA